MDSRTLLKDIKQDYFESGTRQVKEPVAKKSPGRNKLKSVQHTIAGKAEVGRLGIQAAEEKRREEKVLDRILESEGNDDGTTQFKGVLNNLIA